MANARASDIVTLQDAATGSSAQIAVSRGFNCFRFIVQASEVREQPGNAASEQGDLTGRLTPPARHLAHAVEVLYAPPGFEQGQERPSRGGIPLLFPFPGRIAGTTFTWEGKRYELEAGDAFGNAIHGFVMWRPWRIIEQTGSRVVGQFHAWRDDPSLKARWPADFRITAAYTLAGNTLRGDYLVENPCDVPLPCGFGTHPYFRLPLGGPKGGDCLVKLPVSERWELKEMLPTGRRLSVPDAAALQAGKRFGELQLDDVFTGLAFDEGWCRAEVRDPVSGVTIAERFDGAFRECVVFTPPHREAICIEPYTCVPGAFDLAQQGQDVGLRVLPPGGSFAAVVEISARHASPAAESGDSASVAVSRGGN